MIWFLALLALWMALPIIGMGPITFRRGLYARNGFASITLPPDEVTRVQGQHPRGRRAQEVVDYYHRHVPPAVVSALFVIVLPAELGEFVIAFMGLLTFVVSSIWTEVFEDHFELVGHDAECLVAEYDGLEDYREKEIGRMRSLDRTFLTWQAWEIREGMRKRRWITRSLLFLLRWNVGPS